MEIRNLNYFRTIAREQSITTAAKILHVTQPALSKSISDLESELGVQLFDRRRGSIALNAAGELYLCYVERALENLKCGEEIVRSHREGKDRKLFVATYGPIISSAYVEFQKRNLDAGDAGISLHIMETRPPFLARQLTDGSVHFAASLVPYVSDDLECTHIYNDGAMCVVSEFHPLYYRSFLGPADLYDQSLYFVDFCSDMMDLFDQYRLISGRNLSEAKRNIVRSSDMPVDPVRIIEDGTNMMVLPLSSFFFHASPMNSNPNIHFKVLPLINPETAFPVFLIRNRAPFNNRYVQKEFYNFSGYLHGLALRLDQLRKYLSSDSDKDPNAVFKYIDTIKDVVY